MDWIYGRCGHRTVDLWMHSFSCFFTSNSFAFVFCFLLFDRIFVFVFILLHTNTTRHKEVMRAYTGIRGVVVEYLSANIIDTKEEENEHEKGIYVAPYVLLLLLLLFSNRFLCPKYQLEQAIRCICFPHGHTHCPRVLLYQKESNNKIVRKMT